MARSLPLLALVCALCLLAAGPAVPARVPTRPTHPLLTAITDPVSYTGPEAATAFSKTKQAGASIVRLDVDWDGVAPNGKTKPSGFNPSDPADPAYQWDELDREVRMATAHGLAPMISISGAPLWAQKNEPHPTKYGQYKAGPWKPSPVELGRFAHAIATRYDGSFRGLPRVRYWRAWNEPNLIGFLSPQFVNGKPFSPVWYGRMANVFTRAVHAVRPTNLVVAGNLAPFSLGRVALGPLRFTREMLCMSKGARPKATCGRRSFFDAWSVHPYTTGGPSHHAFNADDISLGDLPKVSRLLAAAVRLHHIRSRGKVAFWVTEFSWDTKPPDPHPLAVPIRLQSRWTAEALYRMWSAGVTLVTWFLLRDEEWPRYAFQSGLYFRSGVSLGLDPPKPTLTAFRFPFVAYRRANGTFVWGRLPGSRPGRVIVEERLATRWKRIATIRSDRYGIFQTLLRRPLRKPGRAPRPRAPKSYPATVVADGPTSYWRLGDTGGGTERDLMGVHPGSIQGGVRLGVQGALEGDHDRALSFNGTTGKVDLGTITSPQTIELWVKTTGTKDVPAFSNRDTIGRYITLGTKARLPYVFSSGRLLGATPIANNRWHQLVFTYSGVTGKIYVDGRLDEYGTWVRSEGGARASLAYDAALKSYYKGSIDEVAVYNHPLTAAQVLAHYVASGHVPKPLFPPGSLRARALGSTAASLPFSLTRAPDRYVLPFGGGGGRK